MTQIHETWLLLLRCWRMSRKIMKDVLKENKTARNFILGFRKLRVKESTVHLSQTVIPNGQFTARHWRVLCVQAAGDLGSQNSLGVETSSGCLLTHAPLIHLWLLLLRQDFRSMRKDCAPLSVPWNRLKPYTALLLSTTLEKYDTQHQHTNTSCSLKR